MGLDIGFYKVQKEKYDKTKNFSNSEQIKYFGGRSWTFIPRYFYKDIFICDYYEVYDELIINKDKFEKFREECIKYRDNCPSEISILDGKVRPIHLEWMFTQLISWIDEYLSDWDDNYYLIIFCC